MRPSAASKPQPPARAKRKGMPQTAEKYPGSPVYRAMRDQAWRVGIIACAVWLAFIWLLIAPAFLNHFGYTNASGSVMNVLGYICHQIPERSFHIFEHQIGVCARCFGVYFGVLAGFAAYPFWRDIVDVEPPSRKWLFLATVPIAVDFSLTFAGIWENTQLSRFLTGSILGFACGTFIVPALVEITRNYRPPSAGRADSP